jgi:catechol 2,3-dioxygenase-like lactoylglutathione lyase family enzyme
MLTRALSLILLLALPAAANAQAGFANVIDHVHMAVPDQAKGVEWYHAHFGGESLPEGPDRLMFGNVRLVFQKNAMPKPTYASVLQLIAFSVPDVDAAVKSLEADGVMVLNRPAMVRGVKTARVVDPWGAVLELVQDPKALGLHHILLVDGDPSAALAWLAGTFGGSVAKFADDANGINYGGLWVVVKSGMSEPSAQHAIDHIGFRAINVDESIAALKTKGVKVTAEPRPLTMANGTNVRIAFIEAPDALRIEIVQR